MAIFRLVTEVDHQVFANSKPRVFLFADYYFFKKSQGQELPGETQQRVMM